MDTKKTTTPTSCNTPGCQSGLYENATPDAVIQETGELNSLGPTDVDAPHPEKNPDPID